MSFSIFLCLVLVTALLVASAPLPQVREIRSVNGVLNVTLSIGVHRVETGVVAFDAKVFNGLFPGPTLRLRRNETLKLTIVNTLSGNNPDPGMNSFRQPLTFSYHTHGLHVSPSGQSDNIFLEVHPNQQEQHVIQIPHDHAPGLHWYHSHHHGATMLHMLNGLVGTIVVEDDNSVPMWLQQMKEQVVVMHYLDFTELNEVRNAIADPHPLNATWQKSINSFYTLNGAYLPTIELMDQNWLRLRFVHASHDSFLKLQIRGQGDGVGACEMWLLANDGIAIERPRLVSFIVFLPGSRRDIAFRCNTSGTQRSFEVFGAPGPGPTGNEEAGDDGPVWFTGLIAAINVTDGGITPTGLAIGEKRLWATAHPNYLSDTRGASPDQTFEVDLGLGTSFEEQPAFIAAATACAFFLCVCLALAGCYRAGRLTKLPKRGCLLISGICVFLLTASAVACVIVIATFSAEDMTVNGELYTGKVMLQMKVNTLQEWTLGGQNHPFHIHTNHFQLISHGQPDMWQVGEWYDVVPSNGVIRFHTDRFTGKLVFHCHRLEHEDEGMMAKIEIVP